ncbi:MAG: alanine--tRNA ligase [Candidatus Omnitrophica bacterium]|nr:alanine--tRNA ligase [Candidatus Omnitrophota bacterium]
MDSRAIRNSFLEFFEKKAHRRVPSDSLIPSNDPTLLFTSAGMVQFKDNFLGRSPDPMKRATTCQKCFRTTDIGNVGYTARHHTFFEMLGNFSFGDYFKQEAITWGWEYVTTILELDPARLYPTIFENDDEAFSIWEKEIGIPGDRIQRKGRDDNFWGPVGGSGPCGPCSEILYDQGPHIADPDDRFLEIWNLVFVQFDAQPGQEPHEYPETARKSIDTGAGLERIAAVMARVDTNFETDLFQPYIGHLEEISGKGFQADHETTCAMRVVADHVRAATFAIADKVVPSNVGRGYVLRRIMRRAILHGGRLGLDQGFFAAMVPLVVETMKDIYPDLVAASEGVRKVVSAEEEAFHRTLARGSAILDEKILGDLGGPDCLSVKKPFACMILMASRWSSPWKFYPKKGFPAVRMISMSRWKISAFAPKRPGKAPACRPWPMPKESRPFPPANLWVMTISNVNARCFTSSMVFHG